MRIQCGTLQPKSARTLSWLSNSRKLLPMSHSCPIPCVCANCRSATVSGLQRRTRKKRNEINGRERSSDDGRGRNVAVRQRCSPTPVNVTTTGGALLVHDTLQVLETATLALPILAATATAMTVDVLPTPRAGMNVVVVAQIPVTDDESGIVTLVAVAPLVNGSLDGHARMSLSPIRTASDGAEVAAIPLTGEYGMMVMGVCSSAIAAVRPRSRPPLIESARVLAHHPGHQ
jgi:hypothetical protein